MGGGEGGPQAGAFLTLKADRPWPVEAPDAEGAVRVAARSARYRSAVTWVSLGVVALRPFECERGIVSSPVLRTGRPHRPTARSAEAPPPALLIVARPKRALNQGPSPTLSLIAFAHTPTPGSGPRHPRGSHGLDVARPVRSVLPHPAPTLALRARPHRQR